MHAGLLNVISAWLALGADAAQAAVADGAELPERGLAALVLANSHPSCSVDWLYRRLGITQSGTVRLLDRLQSGGLITRTHPPGQREVEVMLTAAGRKALASGMAARARALQDLLEPLSQSEQEQLAGLISKALSHQERSRERADVVCRLCDWGACDRGCPVDASVTNPAEPGA